MHIIYTSNQLWNLTIPCVSFSKIWICIFPFVWHGNQRSRLSNDRRKFILHNAQFLLHVSIGKCWMAHLITFRFFFSNPRGGVFYPSFLSELAMGGQFVSQQPMWFLHEKLWRPLQISWHTNYDAMLGHTFGSLLQDKACDKVKWVKRPLFLVMSSMHFPMKVRLLKYTKRDI